MNFMVIIEMKYLYDENGNRYQVIRTYYEYGYPGSARVEDEEGHRLTVNLDDMFEEDPTPAEDGG